MKKIINSGDRSFEPVVTDNLVLDDRPNLNSFNSITSDAVARAVAGASGEVPQVTESDNGKVLTAVYDEGGAGVEWGAAPSGLPDTTGASQGDVLAIGSSGPEWATPAAGGGFNPTEVGHWSAEGSGNSVTFDLGTYGSTTSLPVGWYIVRFVMQAGGEYTWSNDVPKTFTAALTGKYNGEVVLSAAIAVDVGEEGASGINFALMRIDGSTSLSLLTAKFKAPDNANFDYLAAQCMIYSL